MRATIVLGLVMACGCAGAADDRAAAADTPSFVTEDVERFAAALARIRMGLDAHGLVLDDAETAWGQAPVEFLALPRAQREVFAHPTLVWGREPDGTWSAVMIARERAPRFEGEGADRVVAWVDDALGDGEVRVSRLGQCDSMRFLGRSWHPSDGSETWARWLEPIRAFGYGAGCAAYHLPGLGLGYPVSGANADDETSSPEEGELWLTLAEIARARLVAERDGAVLFELDSEDGTFDYVATSAAWQAWRRGEAAASALP